MKTLRFMAFALVAIWWTASALFAAWLAWLVESVWPRRV